MLLTPWLTASSVFSARLNYCSLAKFKPQCRVAACLPVERYLSRIRQRPRHLRGILVLFGPVVLVDGPGRIQIDWEAMRQADLELLLKPRLWPTISKIAQTHALFEARRKSGLRCWIPGCARPVDVTPAPLTAQEHRYVMVPTRWTSTRQANFGPLSDRFPGIHVPLDNIGILEDGDKSLYCHGSRYRGIIHNHVSGWLRSVRLYRAHTSTADTRTTVGAIQSFQSEKSFSKACFATGLALIATSADFRFRSSGSRDTFVRRKITPHCSNSDRS